MPIDIWSRSSVAQDFDTTATASLLDSAQSARARGLIREWPFYSASPLRCLDTLSARVGVRKILALDESRRLPLKSFKMLGAVYAAAQAAARQTPGGPSAGQVFDGAENAGGQKSLAHTRLVAASDGNHGRALAWAADKLGTGCSIYLPENVSPGREQKIQAYGAQTIRIAGTYDEAVARAHADAIENGWIII